MATTTFETTVVTPPPELGPTIPKSEFDEVPLTTEFSPPGTWCTGVYSSPAAESGKYWPVYANDASCMPDNYQITTAGDFFYSPGISCPSGYRTACFDSAGVSSITTVTCCPDYEAMRCVSDPRTLEPSLQSYQCVYYFPETGATVMVTTSSEGKTSIARRTFSEGVVWAFGIAMVHQATDLSSASTVSSGTTTGGAAAGGSTTGTAITSPPTASAPSAHPVTDSPSGLSTGAIIAIAVVIPIVVIAALIIAFLLWRRKRAQGQHVPAHIPDHSPPPSDMMSPHMGSSTMTPSTLVATPYTAPPTWQPAHDPAPKMVYYSAVPTQNYHYEMPAGEIPSEMPASEPNVELPGDHSQRRDQGPA